MSKEFEIPTILSPGKRDQFEVWAKSVDLETKIYAHNNMYSHPVTRGAWIAWQALNREGWNTRFATIGPQDSFVAPVQPEGSREAAMVALERDESGRPTVWCDPGVVDLVAALNSAGIATVWSCDGHGHRPATVGLKDGRQLLVLQNLDALASISHLWPDINGNRIQPEPIGYANLHHLKDQSTDGVVLRKRSEFFTVPVYAAPPAQGIDLGQLWEPIKEAVHTALSAHVPGMSQKRREQVAVYVARQMRDGQRSSAPGRKP